MTRQHDERNTRPPDYCGRILYGDYSEELKRRVVECCKRYHAFEETGTPAIPYIAAWREKSDTIWYEYASQRLTDLLDCRLTEVAEVLRNCVIDRRIYRYMNAEAGISKEIKSREELSVVWGELREEGQKTGAIEAVYKIALRKGYAIWLKDQATIETLEADRICLSPGLLTNVSKEMEAEDKLEKHRNHLEAVVQSRTAELTRLNDQLKLEIVERRVAEEALRESEERYRTIFNHAPLGVMHFDSNGIIRDFNDNFAQIMGVPRERLLGFNMLRGVKDQGMLKAVQDVLNGQPGYCKGDYRSVTSGKITPMRAILRPMVSEDGSFLGAVGLFEDITERNRAEVALRQSEEKYRDIVENSVEGILRSAPDGSILSVNPALARMFGFESPEQMIQEVHDIRAHLYRHPKEWLRLLARLRNESELFGYEAEMRRRNGDTFWISINTRCVRAENGEVAFYDAFLTDITEAKQMEEEKAKLEAQLRQAQKMEAIGTLAGGIAHDFNNILAIIMTNVELAELKLGEDSPAKKNIDAALKAAHRGKDLVKQILTFSRVSEQKPIPLQIIPLIKQVMELLRATLPTSIEIRQKIEPAVGDDLILADATQIHQLLMNQVTNAAHAMREEGGILAVTLSCVEFGSGDGGKPEKLRPGKYLKLTVEDTGHGMDRATMERIFDPYFTTKRPGEGTGLGLAVVHGIVKSHGGAIQVNSEPGKGSAFHVYLPKLESGDSSEAKALTPIPKGTERILLVDDEEELVNATKQMLEHLGYKVSATMNGPDALDLFCQQPQHFDLVITDYTMPRMTGVDLVKEMLRIRPDIPIILSTGFNERITGEKAQEIGVNAFVMKPFTVREIAEIVRRVLEKE